VEKDWHINLFDAGVETSKSNRIRKAINRIDAKTLCVTYGDGIGDIDVNCAIDFHRSHGRIATVTGYRPLSQYGVLDIDDQGCVFTMHEKPRLDHWINAGFFVFDRSVLEYLGDNDKIDLETDVMPKLASDGELMVYKHEGFWTSMDTLKDAQNLNNVWNNSAPWKVWGD
jgi:glucose-1-phosphate cytidylyltransferase